jgi:hypothetical protein
MGRPPIRHSIAQINLVRLFGATGTSWCSWPLPVFFQCGGMGATLIYSQRFFESPMVFAYIVVMLCVGLVLDATMRKFQSHFLGWAEESN